MKHNTRILITGGSGFIGTNTVAHFAGKSGVALLNIDSLPPRNKEQQCFWRQVNLLDAVALEQVVAEFAPHYIIHLGARTDLNGSTLNDYAANIEGVQNLLQASAKCDSLKKIIITSSMLVCHAGYQPQNQFDYAPSTVYGRSKVETERIVWKNPPKCDWAIVRPTSIWGPWFDEPYKNFFDMVISKRYFHIGNRSCTKTYGYVKNAVYQIEQILFSDTRNENHKVYYLGDTPATNIQEWADEIADMLGYNILTMPYWLIKIAAWVGDVLKRFGIRFPMTSFRLKNMTTDNVLDLHETLSLAPNSPVTRPEGVRNTLEWMLKYKA